MYKKIISALATLFLFAGFFLAFLPHAVHVRTHVHSGLEGEEGYWYTAYGIVLVVFSLLLLIWSSGARISFLQEGIVKSTFSKSEKVSSK